MPNIVHYLCEIVHNVEGDLVGLPAVLLQEIEIHSKVVVLFVDQGVSIASNGIGARGLDCQIVLRRVSQLH